MALAPSSLLGAPLLASSDFVMYNDLLETAPDIYFFGHWHKDQGVVHMGDKTFINIGSLTRGSLSQDEMERKPACAHEVFDVEWRVRQEKQQVEMDSFVTKIREALVEGSQTTPLSSLVSGMGDVPAQVREKALGYLEQT